MNAADHFIDRHLREGRGDRTVFIDPSRRLSYAELAEASARFAAGLRRAGIERERRIALIMLDTVEFPIAFWGAIRAGVVPVPINTLLPSDLVASILADSRAAAAVVSAPLVEGLRPALDRVPTVVADLAGFLAEPDPAEQPRRLVARRAARSAGDHLRQHDVF